MQHGKLWKAACPAATAALLAGCALASATAPTVDVASVQLRGVGVLDQALDVSLCVYNPNPRELAFQRVRAGLDVAGSFLAESESEVPVVLPPRAATVVQFSVGTTVRNLGPQLLSVLQTGSVAYRLHGTVQLAGSLGLTIPFSRSGRLDAVSIGSALLADAATPGGTACRRAP